jgi:hypothetical protein
LEKVKAMPIDPRSAYHQQSLLHARMLMEQRAQMQAMHEARLRVEERTREAQQRSTPLPPPAYPDPPKPSSERTRSEALCTANAIRETNPDEARRIAETVMDETRRGSIEDETAMKQFCVAFNIHLLTPRKPK